jgi:predicted MFS family arabinose efflux permease
MRSKCNVPRDTASTAEGRDVVCPAPVALGASPGLSRAATLLFSITCGLAVANIAYALPLLDRIAGDFGIGDAAAGIVITTTQIGYGLGLLLVVPLGDLVDRRRLIIGQSLLSAATLLAVAWAPTRTALLIAFAAVGLLSVVAQVAVAYASVLTDPSERGRTVGAVTTGIVVGILLARTVSGTLADLLGWRSVYLISAAATLVAVGLMLEALPRQPTPSAPMSFPRLIGSTLRLFAEEPILRVRALLALLSFAAFTTLVTSMALALAAPPFSLSHAKIGSFGLAGLAGALGAARAGRMADRGRAQQTTGLGLGLMLASWVPSVLLGRSLWGLVVGTFVFEFGLQSVHVSNQTLIYRVRPEAQSRLAASYMIFYSVGSATGSIVSTLVYARAGWTGVCVVGAMIGALAIVFWATTRHLTPDVGSDRSVRVR